MSDDLLQIQVAGTTIVLKENEAALVIYAPNKQKGKEVSISLREPGAYSSRHTAKTTFVERMQGSTPVYAAIFPRIPMGERESDTCKYYIRNWHKYSMAFVGSPNYESGNRYYKDGEITIYAGNVTELDLRDAYINETGDIGRL